MEKLITPYEEEIKALEAEEKELYITEKRIEKTYIQDLLTFFQNEFKDAIYTDVTITGGRNYIYFNRMEEGRTKEIFSIYLREDYFVKGAKFNSLSLSYYTTSTVSKFETERLVMLGRAAEVLLNKEKEILAVVNEKDSNYKAILKETGVRDRLYTIQGNIETLRYQIRETNKEITRAKLFSEEGVVFEKPKYIKLKFNFEPKIKAIKVKEVSKSGKLCTVQYSFTDEIFNCEKENVKVGDLLHEICK